MGQVLRDQFHATVAKQWLGIVGSVIDSGCDERDILAITELAVTGTLHMLRDLGVDPNAAFERLSKQVNQRVADMQGDGRKETGLVLNG